jgi:hypothetical protein
VVTVVAAVVLGIAVLPLAGASGRVGPGHVSLQAGWSLGGGSQVNVPPVGRVSFPVEPLSPGIDDELLPVIRRLGPVCDSDVLRI